MNPEDPSTIDGSGSGSVAPPGIRLIHGHGSLAGQVSAFAVGPVTIGRRVGLELSFDQETDVHVSGRHARLVADGAGNWLIEDLGSTNGTLLNGNPVSQPSRLHHGDVVVLGRSRGASGSCDFTIELEGQHGSPRPGMGASIRPFRTPSQPLPDAAGYEVPVHPLAGAHDAAGGEGDRQAGFLGLGRIKGAFGRFVGRREAQRALEQASHELGRTRMRVEEANRALGRAAWGERSIEWSPYPAAEGCQGFDDRLREIESERLRHNEARESLEREFAEFDDLWKSEHAELESRHEELTENIDQANSALAEAKESVRSALSAHIAHAAELGRALSEFAETQTPDPSDDVEARLEILAADAAASLADFEAPIDGLGERLAARADAAKALEQAESHASEIAENLAASSARRSDRLADKEKDEAELNRLLEELEKGARRLDDEWAGAFAKLGGELARANEPALAECPELRAALDAARQQAQLEARVADLEQQLASLR